MSTRSALGLTPVDADWWWTVGLDGVVGAVLGVAVTAVALLSSFKAERRRADEARAERKLELAKVAVLGLQRASSRLGLQVSQTIPRPRGQQTVDRFTDLLTAFGDARGQLHDWPGMIQQLDRAMDGLEAAMRGGRRRVVVNVASSANDLTRVCVAWLSDPARYEVDAGD